MPSFINQNFEKKSKKLAKSLKNRETTTFAKSLLTFIKEYGLYLYLAVSTSTVIFDYFIYTVVFHLNQADFFNYFMPSVFSKQTFIIFILFPFLVLSSFIPIYKIQYDFLKKQETKNYFYNVDECIYIAKGLFYSFFAIFGGDYLIYKVLLFASSQLNVISFGVILFFLFSIVNLIIFRLAVSIAILIKDFANKKNNFKLSQYLLNTQINSYIVYIVFFLLKLNIIAIFLPDMFLFESINLCVSLLIIILLPDIPEKENKAKLGLFFVISLIVFMCFSVGVLFKNLDALYKEPYEKFSFWNKKIYENSLTINFSLLLSPVKISPLRDDLNISLLFKDKNTSQYITDKNIDENSSKSINYTIHSFIEDSNSSKKKVFYLPNGNRKILFMLADKNQSDVNKTITVLHIRETNSSKIDLIDIGYIKSK